MMHENVKYRKKVKNNQFKWLTIPLQIIIRKQYGNSNRKAPTINGTGRMLLQPAIHIRKDWSITGSVTE